MNKYSIICHIESRVVASLSLDGELTIYHDHFLEDDNFNLKPIIEAFDKWNIFRKITHTSRKGLKQSVLEQLNILQKEKPGKMILSPLKG